MHVSIIYLSFHVSVLVLLSLRRTIWGGPRAFLGIRRVDIHVTQVQVGLEVDSSTVRDFLDDIFPFIDVIRAVCTHTHCPPTLLQSADKQMSQNNYRNRLNSGYGRSSYQIRRFKSHNLIYFACHAKRKNTIKRELEHSMRAHARAAKKPISVLLSYLEVSSIVKRQRKVTKERKRGTNETKKYKE